MWKAARKHLRSDPILKNIIKRVGPCTLAPRRDYFIALCKAVYSLQISTKIAAILFERFSQRFPRRRPTPQRVIDLLTNGDEASIKGIGLSRQKRAYLLDLARHFSSGEIPTRSFAGMT